MATPTTTARRAQGFGAQRFLVRGADFTSEESLAEIRPRITDYPERVPLITGFPLAGRRGGSRPRPQVLAEGQEPLAPGGLFPEARKRDPNVLQGVTAGLTPAQIANTTNARNLGFPRTHFAEVAAGLTLVVPTVALPGPAIITRLEVQCTITAISPQVQIAFRYSGDNNTTGGFSTTGSRFFLAGSAVFDIIMPLDRMVWTPNVLVPLTTWFLKIIVANNQAATITVVTSYSVEWL